MTPATTLLQSAVNALGLALLVWFGGPLLAIGGVRPLETPGARWAVLLGTAALLLLVGPLQQWRTRRRNAALVDVLQPAAGEQSLAPRFQQAMTLLREGIDAGPGAPMLRWWRRRQQLVRLPWYLFIGAPGAGKTTALLNSGLRFPLADRLGTAPVKGVAGTRQCDWWFTDRAVFIDTAGRYTTQDSHADNDAREWRSFLGLLRKHRPRQPINGVLVTVSVPDLLAGGAELARQCAAVNARLQELRGELGLTLPVYVLVTKADLLAGFAEFFDRFDIAQRMQVWGTTLPYTEPGTALGRATLAADLHALVERLQARTLQCLQQEPALTRRSPIYHFAAQVDALLPALTEFVEKALAQADQPPPQVMRGVYLSSGTQEGNPIDRVLGAIARQSGVAARVLPRPDGKGKAFFLQQLLQAVVIAEADLAGGNLQRLQRDRRIAQAGTALACTVLLGLAGAWWVSYGNNRDYVDQAGKRVQQLAQRVSTAVDGPSAATRWLPLYQLLRDLPHPGGVDATTVPPGHGWGLFQGGRLARSSEQTYHRVLANTLAPALADRLAAELKDADADPARRHQTLKTYLMLVDRQRLDRATVRAWAAQAFALSPDGPVDAAERDEWLQHVDALLERNAFQDAVTVDEAAVQSARKALAAVPLPQRMLARLKREPADAAPRRLDAWLGPLLPLLFDPVGDKSAQREMATLYTRQGLVGRLLPQLDGVVQQLTDEDAWVLGTRPPAGDQPRIDAAARAKLLAEVSRLYATEYAEQWQAALGAWQLHRPADADALARLNSQLAAADSPLRHLIGVARNELAFADLPPTPEIKVIDAVLAERFGALRAYANGPGPAAIDRALGAVARFTLGSGTDSGAAQIAQALRQEAAAAPAPYNAVWSALADSLLAAHRSALRQGLAARLEDVVRQCRSVIGDRYPFNAAAVQNDVNLADFARLFGPNGIFDTFFRKDLQPHVDTRSRPWRYRDGQGVAGESLLRSFERIEDLRRLFFSAGSPLPQLRFGLRPIEMDVTLEEFLLDVDGQLLRYENGPSVLRTMTWPGPAASQRVTLRARGLPGEVHEGPWALLRVLSREPWARGASQESSRVSVAVAGRRLLLDLSLPGQASIAPLAGLANFRCPEGRP